MSTFKYLTAICAVQVRLSWDIITPCKKSLASFSNLKTSPQTKKVNYYNFLFLSIKKGPGQLKRAKSVLFAFWIFSKITATGHILAEIRGCVLSKQLCQSHLIIHLYLNVSRATRRLRRGGHAWTGHLLCAFSWNIFLLTHLTSSVRSGNIVTATFQSCQLVHMTLWEFSMTWITLVYVCKVLVWLELSPPPWRTWCELG